MSISKPLANEYANFYQGYIELVGEEPILQYLNVQSDSFVQFLKEIPTDRLKDAYEPGKWTIAEVIGHVIDVERVMAYRALRFSRADKTVLAGFEQDDYVANGHFNKRSLESLVAEFEGLRIASIEMINGIDEDQSLYTGEANGAIFSVRALIYIMAGHVAHHRQVLVSRYGL